MPNANMYAQQARGEGIPLKKGEEAGQQREQLLRLADTPAPCGQGRRSRRQASVWPPAPVRATECQHVFCFPVETDLKTVRNAVESLRCAGRKQLSFKPKRWQFHCEQPTWKVICNAHANTYRESKAERGSASEEG